MAAMIAGQVWRAAMVAIGRFRWRRVAALRMLRANMGRNNPLKGWQVDRAAIRHVGRDLQRPECVLAERDGTVWAADARGGAMRIAPDGSQQLVVPQQPAPGAAADFQARYVQSQGSLP